MLQQQSLRSFRNLSCTDSGASMGGAGTLKMTIEYEGDRPLHPLPFPSCSLSPRLVHSPRLVYPPRRSRCRTGAALLK